MSAAEELAKATLLPRDEARFRYFAPERELKLPIGLKSEMPYKTTYERCAALALYEAEAKKEKE